MTSHSRRVLTSSKTDEHYTPSEVLDCVYDCFSPIGVDLDPCSNAPVGLANVAARRCFTIADDGLKQPWIAETVYMNPPYSRVAPWIKKAVAAYRDGSCKEIIALVKADTSTRWFSLIWQNATVICFVTRRLKFLNEANQGRAATFASAIVYFGANSEKFRRSFQSFGVFVEHKQWDFR